MGECDETPGLRWCGSLFFAALDHVVVGHVEASSSQNARCLRDVLCKRVIPMINHGCPQVFEVAHANAPCTFLRQPRARAWWVVRPLMLQWSCALSDSTIFIPTTKERSSKNDFIDSKQITNPSTCKQQTICGGVLAGAFVYTKWTHTNDLQHFLDNPSATHVARIASIYTHSTCFRVRYCTTLSIVDAGWKPPLPAT